MAGLRVMEGPGWMQLDLCGEHHAESHDAHTSKYLTYDQIIAVAYCVIIAQQQSAATLRRKMQMAGPLGPGKNITPHLLRSMRRRVRMSRAQLTAQQLQGIAINDSFGSLRALSYAKWFATLVARHNDSNDTLFCSTLIASTSRTGTT
jgi:hypothetical protein